MFQEINAPNIQDLFGFHPYPSIEDRDAWQALDGEWKAGTIALGESFLKFPYPSLTATDYMDFTRTGNRSRYEEKYFSKRRALDALALAECVEDKGRFLGDIVNGIFSICEESAWQLPAHNTYVRDAPQLPLPDAANPVLDLFACETGAVLATVYYLLKNRLDAISPFITERITYELRQRIFTPYLNRHFWWMGNGKEHMNNWTIWCTQNVLLSIFLTGAYKELGKEAMLKACRSTAYFLAEYGEDGCCDEGAQYYRHSGLCLFQILEIVNASTKNSFQQLYQEPKIKNIAAYILNVHIHGKYYVNFADCSPVAGRAGVREFLFAERTGNTELLKFAAQEFMAGGKDSLLLPEENNLFYRLANGFTAARVKEYAASVHGAVLHPDIFYPSTGLFIARDESLCLAVKAGNNGDSHNHNDTGSFTIYKNGLPLFIDVGVESYTKKTFSPQRYEIWTMQSAYHNLPSINGMMQSDGESYGATDVLWQMGNEECSIEMDFSGAYPKEAGLAYYRRRASLLKGKEIIIKDSFQFHEQSDPSSVVLSLMTYEKPTLLPDGDGFTLQIGGLGQLTCHLGVYLETEAIPITDARLAQAWKHEVYRTLVSPSGNSLEFHIS